MLSFTFSQMRYCNFQGRTGFSLMPHWYKRIPLQGLSPQSKVAPLVVYNLFPSGSEEASWPLISALLAQPLPPHISFIWISSGSVTFVRPFLCVAGVNKNLFACPCQDRQVPNLERQFQKFYFRWTVSEFFTLNISLAQNVYCGY